MENTLYYGDNLDVLKLHIKDESVDLIYLDPPFNSNATYNVLFAEKNGSKAASQIKAFDDTWHWNIDAEKAYVEMVERGGKVSDAMRAFRTFLGDNDMMAYLAMMAPRLVELRRVLKSTGSIYLHCDPTASHYLKLLMDAIFSPENFKNEIIWQRTNAHNDAGQFGRIHDVLLFYVRSSKYTWNPITTTYSTEQIKRYKKDENGRLYTAQDLTASRPDSDSGKFNWRGTMPPSSRGWGYTLEQLELWWDEGLILKKKDGTPRMDGLIKYLDKMPGKPLQSIWTDIQRIGNTSAERLGYPTQKPLTLLERIIKASSNKGDIILDPFCGCGTAIDAAQRLDRKWIGIDITHLAITLIKHRLKTSYGDDFKFKVIGEPVDITSTEMLAKDDPYQFQFWSLGLVGARPLEEKKGADKGIDGKIFFHDEKGGKSKQIIISVKAGKTQVSHVRDLRGVLDREKAEIGVLICMQDPTREMEKEAATGGFYSSPWSPDTKYPRLQILTIEDLMNGKTIAYPGRGKVDSTFKSATRIYKKPTEKQQELNYGDD